MASITTRNLEDDLKANLRIISAQNDHSMKKEVRCILSQFISHGAPIEKELGSKLKARFEGLTTEDFSLPNRQAPRLTNFD